jgi:hypothetical protein
MAPTKRFVEMAISFERVAADQGFPAAARSLIPRFVSDLRVDGDDAIPKVGPLVIASNHPGTIDSILHSAIAGRTDIKIIATGGQFLRELPVAVQNLIHVSMETGERVMALRQALRHVKQGGALLLFPSGRIDPDPALLSGAEKELECWSGSINVICNHVPEVQIIIAIVSGVLAGHWFNFPLVRLYNDRFKRQQVAEFFQVMQYMLFPKSQLLSPRITYSSQITVKDLVGQDDPFLRMLIPKARDLLHQHNRRYNCLS